MDNTELKQYIEKCVDELADKYNKVWANLSRDSR